MPLFFGKEKVNVSGQPLSTIELKYSGSPSTSSVLSILDYVTVGDGVIIENGIASNFRSSVSSYLTIPAEAYSFEEGKTFRLTFTTGEEVNETNGMEQILYYPEMEFFIRGKTFMSYGSSNDKIYGDVLPNTKYILDWTFAPIGIRTLYDADMNILAEHEVKGPSSMTGEMILGNRATTNREFYGTIDLNNTGILL